MDQGSNYEYDCFQMLEALQSRHHSADRWPMLLLGSGVVEPGTVTFGPSNPPRTILS